MQGYLCSVKRFTTRVKYAIVNLKKRTAMKKKALLLAGLCAFGLFAWEAQAVSLGHISIINAGDNVPTGYEKIELRGDLDVSIGPNSISAGVNDNSVYLHFNRNLGNVSVSLYNPAGVLLYNNVVNTAVQQTIIIPIANNSGNGDYYITLDNANGFAEGEFERN